MDLPGWQAIYEAHKDSGFEIIAAAQDTGGEAAAGPIYDEAAVTFTALIDPRHTISSLYQMVNVPAGVWIDEEGVIVRPPEVAYSKQYDFSGLKAGDDRYARALVDWVENGSASRYVMDREALAAALAPGDAERGRADACFRLASELTLRGRLDEARPFYHEAQKLHPESWNYHRQEWTQDPEDQRRAAFMTKYKGLGGKPYYDPAALPD